MGGSLGGISGRISGGSLGSHFGVGRLWGGGPTDLPEWEHCPPPLLQAMHSIGAAIKGAWAQLSMCRELERIGANSGRGGKGL
eukprot:1880257-Pleurochrysis_carterae.AAC.1